MSHLLHPIRTASTAAVIGITAVGAFSRLTSGRYTPRFYEYQLDRAPNNASTRFIPVVDIILATVSALPTTRIYGLFVTSIFYSIGVIVRLKEGKDATRDTALFALGGLAWWSEFAGW